MMADAASVDPVSTDPVSTDPVSTDPVSTDPVSTDAASVDPVSTDPASVDAVSVDPSSVVPVSADPVSADSAEKPSQDDNCPIFRLGPDYLLANIFSRLRTSDKRQVAQVCKTFRGTVDDLFFWPDTSTAKIELSERNSFLPLLLEQRGVTQVAVCNENSLLSVMEHMPGLQTLDLKYYLDVDFHATLAEIACPNLPNLTQLRLGGCSLLDDENVKLLGLHLPQLTHLDLSGCTLITDHSMEYVMLSFSELVDINLDGCYRLTEEGIIVLAVGGMPLRRVHLGHLPNMTDDVFHIVGYNLAELEEVELEGCKLTNEGLQQLSQIDELAWRHLGLSATTIDGDTFRYLGQMGRLSSLSIVGCPSVDDALRHLVAMGSLRTLSLRDCTVGGAGLTHLTRSGCRIESLRLNNCHPVTDQDLMYVAALLHLHTLCLNRCTELTADGFRPLYRLDADADIRVLHLAHMAVTDVHFEHLSRVRNLRFLTMTRCTLGAEDVAGLQFLDSEYSRLRHLNVWHCEGVTAEAVLAQLTSFRLDIDDEDDDVNRMTFLKRDIYYD